ncbi:PP2C family protein-serine/threonine phosphatase [Conexibacter sp. SYSU D00693]|uniref:PP2C family protein-serine/threonine phosphatase n=1 Tax=Conexibacter sp. SYSU D00693 TaxID=2812560 RepID=UPI00196B0009|nr:PP2C family protein-serine/threonine phosphatase [Conexibacter sp. SYSU D00693]
MRGISERQRVLALIWLVGSVLTWLTLVLPYDSADIPFGSRATVATVALVCAAGLWWGPPLPARAIHLLLVAGAGVVAFCTSLGIPAVEAPMVLLLVVYAFATFSPRAAVGHLVLNIALLAVVLATAPADRDVAPWISFVIVSGVAVTLSIALARIVTARERERVDAERDRRIAGELQRTLLPIALPEVPGAALAARYLPAAGDEADVGGDVYDAFELPDGRLCLAVADVAGKGLRAAQAVGGLRSALRAYALEDADPSLVLRRMDALVQHGGVSTEMATLLVVVVDAQRRTIDWASAGHPPPLRLSTAGPVFLPGAPGAPLGCEDVHPAPRHTEALADGDALLLFSDGLVERRGETLDAGFLRLATAAARAGHVALPILLDAVLPVAARPLQDDVTALVIRFEGGAPSPEAAAGDVAAQPPVASAPLGAPA